ncbi:MAG: peptidyl-prolyl cis-trans isomerase [Chlamydiales bacterium]|nr:peptidyl-prolyl cis-trans isomerase [Chlamydiales bacterium]
MTNPVVAIRTSEGDIEVELFANKAPGTVENFLRYLDEKHYNKTIFHRVIDGFMIQGGGMTADMKEKQTHQPIKNEASNGLSNKRGTLAMARTSEIHSATSQFFINVVDNEFLDFRSPTPSGYGYCVFGEVKKGMEVVDKIKKAETSTRKGHSDVPIKAIEIIEIVRK